MTEPSFKTSLLSGAMAGVCVDISMYPIDTIKTRLQSAEGFVKAGGFNGVYRGIGAAAIGSGPGSAFFFTAYEQSKHRLQPILGQDSAYTHMGAAAIGEVMACLVRVPTENVKQKMQVGLYKTVKEGVSGIMKTQGFKGFYTGYVTTVAREIPFSFIQFPIWERMKREWALQQGAPVAAWQGALCGSISGAFAAAITTPLDVCKTRLMVDTAGKYSGMMGTMSMIYKEEGWRALFLGIQPRVMWIGIGGFVFFGAYEKTKEVLGGMEDEQEL